MRQLAGLALCAVVTLLVGCSANPTASTPALPVQLAPHPDPRSALGNTDPVLAANKRLVFDMWRTVVNAGQIEVADQMLAEGYIQHSPVLRTGRSAFKQIFSVIPRRAVPELVEPPLVASIAEGDLVVMSLFERYPATNAAPAGATAHFNLFRVAEGRLAEHWHSVRTPPGADVPLPEDGGPQLVQGARGADQQRLLAAVDPALARNKRLVFDLWREVVEAGQQQRADRYIARDFVEHDPNGQSGLAGTRAHFAARADRPVQKWIAAPVVAIVAEGELVALVTMQELPHPHRSGRTYTTTWFNQFRIQRGRVVEHWSAATPADLPGDSVW